MNEMNERLKPANIKNQFLSLMTFMFMAASSVLAIAADINGQWYLEGYYADGDLSLVSPPSRLSGTVQIAGGQLVFATNQGAWTDTVVWNQVGFQHTYTKENYSSITSDGITHPFMSSSEIWMIRVINDTTLLLSYGIVDYEPTYVFDEQVEGPKVLTNIYNYEWVSAVLTAAPVALTTAPSQVSPRPWTGNYTSHAFELEETNRQSGVSGVSIQSPVKLIKSDADYQLFQYSEMIPVLATADPTKLSAPEMDASRYLLWEDEDTKAYNVIDRTDWYFLYLGDGRIFSMETSSTLADLYWSFDPNTAVRLFADVFQSAYLLVPESIGSVSMITGNVQVLRDGQEVALLNGNPMYEGDVLKTGNQSSARVTFDDGCKMTVGANSSIKVERFKVEKSGGFIEWVKSYLRVNLLEGRLENVETGQIKNGFSINNEYASSGVRGTQFSMEMSQSGGLATTTVQVSEGIVDLKDLTTGQVHEVLAGGSMSVVAPIVAPTLTLNVPGGSGAIWVNGVLIEDFPHVVTGQVGEVIDLLAEPADGRNFYRWWGVDEWVAEKVSHVLGGNVAMHCEFVVADANPSDVFLDAMVDAGLEGECTVMVFA